MNNSAFTNFEFSTISFPAVAKHEKLYYRLYLTTINGNYVRCASQGKT